MKRIKDEYIDIVKSRVDICQLVLDLCPGTVLTTAGPHRKKCCCVFHDEDTPSLMLDTALNLYHCFGCGKGDDVITFVKDVQGIEFTDAVRTLLDMYCPDIDSHDLFEKTGCAEDEEVYHKCETMYIYNEYAQEFFRAQNEDDTEEAVACRHYAEKTDESPDDRWDKKFCRAFGLGYSPMRGNKFLQFAKEMKLNLEILAKMGLLGEDEHRPGTMSLLLLVVHGQSNS